MTATLSRLSSDGVLTCVVCLEDFDEEDHRPLLLPACGHTFCRLCLVSVLDNDNVKGHFLCPTCRRPQSVRSAEDLPSNYSLLELVRREITLLNGSSSGDANPTPTNELCPEHGSRLSFWCTTCELAACGECLFDRHPRPEHEVVKAEDHLIKLQELMKKRSTRLVTQLTSVLEENTTKVKEALVNFIEFLRQRRVLSQLLEESKTIRAIARESADLGSLSSVNETLMSLERKYDSSQIDSEVTVTVSNPFGSRTSGESPGNPKCNSGTVGPGTTKENSGTKDTFKVKERQLLNLRSTLPEYSNQVHYKISNTSARTSSNFSLVIASFPEPLDETSPEWVFGLRSQPAVSSHLPKPTSAPIPVDSSACFKQFPVIPTPTTEKRSVSTQTTQLESSSGGLTPEEQQEPANGHKSKIHSNFPCDPPWPSVLCGTLGDNWTSSKITRDPRGIHVHSLEPMKEKCDVFLSLPLISSLTPGEAPIVFMDLQEGSKPLGRVYITLQIHLLRARQFLSLCLGDRGCSYRGSSFHSVLRRGNPGEGLAGGDYEGKAGKGGQAILRGLEPSKEIARYCERGMVSRLTAESETAAQFCINVRDGLRTKAVFPFGRVCQGIAVVEEACRRPSFSVSVANCGCVLPF